VPPATGGSRLPTYVEQETAPAADEDQELDDDELQLLSETLAVDRTSTEPLPPMEEVLQSIAPLQQPVTMVTSCNPHLQPNTTCTDNRTCTCVHCVKYGLC